MKDESLRYGSDLIVDVLRQYGIQYISCNPGATFRGLHDSLVNGDEAEYPELILCCHEEIAVALAHGYAKASGKFMAVLLHSNIGVLHASMAIFNAWCDRIPMLIIGGCGPMAIDKRRPWIDWIHTSLYQGGVLTDYIKWQDQPVNLPSTLESLYRACKITNTHPQAPVFISIDASIQEAPLESEVSMENVAKLAPPSPPQADHNALQQIAKWLLEADMPVIFADHLGRNDQAVLQLIKLAELLGIAVVDCGGRFNFPNTHPLCWSGIDKQFLAECDFVLALDVRDLWGALSYVVGTDKHYTSYLSPNCKVVYISLEDYLVRSWAADYHKLYPVDMAVTGDASHALSQLYRLCLPQVSSDKKSQIKQRYNRSKQIHHNAREQWQALAQEQQQNNPPSMPNVLWAIWQAIKDEDFVLTNYGSYPILSWVYKLWELKTPGCYLGTSGGAGLGYGLGASVGAALAHKNSGKLCIDLQADGDLLFTPSALWTAAHCQLPLLILVMNNRSYHNTREHALQIAKHRDRSSNNSHIGTALEHPRVDYLALAQAFGIRAFTAHEVSAIVPVLQESCAILKKNQQPVLVDILFQ